MAGPLRCLRPLPVLLRRPLSGVARPSARAPLQLGGSGASLAGQMVQARLLATKKAKAKGKAQLRVNINPSLVEDIINLEEVSEEMRSVVRALQEEFSKNVSIRTSPGALDHLTVQTKDGKFPLNQLAQVSVRSSQLIVVNMSSFPESTAAAIKAIRESGLNLNPEADGSLIRVPIPTVTRKYRENLAGVAKQLANKAKESLRKVRSQAVSRARKSKGTVSEDTLRLIEKQVQQMADDTTAEMDKLLAAKTKELLG